ncbi:hypothetical protein KIPB_001625 [Kipferlia bialata]|uniref:RING-type domain-containing protein n=1 Tax=Kipferlia bialata TaxID=797122 RepID=A0A9K3GFD3_9EUKA|nr:hypothetical protein KIPB_001625 [Kipferlia bialata]|eukprot:g1625.t1
MDGRHINLKGDPEQELRRNTLPPSQEVCGVCLVPSSSVFRFPCGHCVCAPCLRAHRSGRESHVCMYSMCLVCGELSVLSEPVQSEGESSPPPSECSDLLDHTVCLGGALPRHVDELSCTSHHFKSQDTSPTMADALGTLFGYVAELESAEARQRQRGDRYKLLYTQEVSMRQWDMEEAEGRTERMRQCATEAYLSARKADQTSIADGIAREEAEREAERLKALLIERERVWREKTEQLMQRAEKAEGMVLSQTCGD